MEYSQPGGSMKQRPTGVTILAVLYFIQGLMWLGLPAIITGVFGEFMDLPGVLGATMLCWGISAVFMLIYFVIGYGLLKGLGWARVIAIILAILGLLNFPIGTIISIIILIYLFKDDVKAYFR